MSVITISRGSYSNGKAIAEEVAGTLGYECVSRDILIEACEHFNIPEIKLVSALHDAPSLLDRFSFGKEQYVAYIREAFLQHMVKDNVVYHGLAGHFFLKGVGHNLKVRILADINDRIRLEMEREEIPEAEARHRIEKDDYERRKWSMALYGIDTADPRLYDLVVHVRKISVADAADIICHAAGLSHFETTADSQKAVEDLYLAARVKVAIINIWPKADVRAQSGIVSVQAEGPLEQEEVIGKKIAERVMKMDGVKDVRFSLIPF